MYCQELAELIDLHPALREHGFDLQLASHGSNHGLQGADVHELHASEVSFSVDYGRDDYLLGLHAINHPIAANDQFVDVLVLDSGTLRQENGNFSSVLVSSMIRLTTEPA